MKSEVRPAPSIGEPSTIAAGAARPRDGDVIVSRQSETGDTYAIRQVPGDVQLQAGVRDDAIRIARSFAQHATVDLWYSDDSGRTLLEEYRQRRSML